MSFRNRLVLPVILSALAVLAGCGSNTKIVPPPTGGFKNSNFTGTYVFSVIGSDLNSFPVELTGTLTADGNGGITSGFFDVNNPQGLGVGSLTVTSGSKYNVTADGRGTVTVKTSSGNFGFDFVLTSNSHGLITEFDTGATGSGTLDLQATVDQSALAGSWALSMTGFDGNVNPMGTIAGFTLDTSGNISNGVQDINDSQTVLAQLTLSGVVPVGAAGAPGAAQLVTETSLGTLQFDVYTIDANHLKFIEVDNVAYLTGDAFPQQASVPTGTNVFTLAGVDFLANPTGPFVAGGFLVTDGNGNVSGSSSEDLNDVGNVTTGIGFAGLYDTTLVNGRSTLTLIGFNNATLSNTTTFAAYPSVGGLQLLEIDASGITAGSALLQSSTTLASGQGYGLNLSAVNTNSEEDDIAEFTNTNGSFSGVVDFNDSGVLDGGRSFKATYAADSSNSGRGQVTSSAFNLISYVVDDSTTVFIEQDTTQLGIGTFQVQSTSARSNLAASHLSMLRMKGARFAKGNLKRR